MNCDYCVSEQAGKAEHQSQPIESAIYAVREHVDGQPVIMMVCAKHMEWLYNMRETVLLVAKTYIPEDEDEDK